MRHLVMLALVAATVSAVPARADFEPYIDRKPERTAPLEDIRNACRARVYEGVEQQKAASDEAGAQLRFWWDYGHGLEVVSEEEFIFNAIENCVDLVRRAPQNRT